MCLVVFFNASSLKTDLLLFNLAALLPETQPQTNIVPSPPAETFNWFFFGGGWVLTVLPPLFMKKHTNNSGAWEIIPSILGTHEIPGCLHHKAWPCRRQSAERPTDQGDDDYHQLHHLLSGNSKQTFVPWNLISELFEELQRSDLGCMESPEKKNTFVVTSTTT